MLVIERSAGAMTSATGRVPDTPGTAPRSPLPRTQPEGASPPPHAADPGTAQGHMAGECGREAARWPGPVLPSPWLGPSPGACHTRGHESARLCAPRWPEPVGRPRVPGADAGDGARGGSDRSSLGGQTPFTHSADAGLVAKQPAFWVARTSSPDRVLSHARHTAVLSESEDAWPLGDAASYSRFSL